jgi:hypothetical protein
MTRDQPGIVFRSELSRAFRLTRALFVLDGAVLFDAQAPEDKSLPSEIPVVTGAPPPGDHVLQVFLDIRGYGEGANADFCRYRFEVKSAHSFTVKAGQLIRLEAIAWEKIDDGRPWYMHPRIRYVSAERNSGRADFQPREPHGKTVPEGAKP